MNNEVLFEKLVAIFTEENIQNRSYYDLYETPRMLKIVEKNGQIARLNTTIISKIKNRSAPVYCPYGLFSKTQQADFLKQLVMEDTQYINKFLPNMVDYFGAQIAVNSVSDIIGKVDSRLAIQIVDKAHSVSKKDELIPRILHALFNEKISMIKMRDILNERLFYKYITPEQLDIIFKNKKLTEYINWHLIQLSPEQIDTYVLIANAPYDFQIIKILSGRFMLSQKQIAKVWQLEKLKLSNNNPVVNYSFLRTLSVKADIETTKDIINSCKAIDSKIDIADKILHYANSVPKLVMISQLYKANDKEVNNILFKKIATSQTFNNWLKRNNINFINLDRNNGLIVKKQLLLKFIQEYLKSHPELNMSVKQEIKF